jgi:hypothetical protein
MHDYPTILVARDDGLDCRLVQSLQRTGFHVLEAEDWAQVFHAVRVHSRPIHLLLVNENMDAHIPMLRDAAILTDRSKSERDHYWMFGESPSANP